MKHRAVARQLRASCSKGEIADFFLAPDQRPDLLMHLLIENRKSGRGNRDLEELLPGWTGPAGGPPGQPPRAPQRRRNWKHLVFRNLVLLCFFMFLSCAIAPNYNLVEPEKPELAVPETLVLDPDSNVEPVEVAAQAAWFMLRSILTDRPAPEELRQSFGARLVNGDWSGILLIDPLGRTKGLVREDSANYVSDWIVRSEELEEENQTLYNAMIALKKTQDSKKLYLEIDQANTRLYVKMGTATLYDFPIVCGKGFTPRELGRVRRFATPRGILHVQSKETNPIWRPPPWHWTERGESPPAYRHGVPGVLGKYRLNLGDGYGIHGTSGSWISPGRYSHGCIRMNAKDLAVVFKLADVGTEVFIY